MHFTEQDIASAKAALEVAAEAAKIVSFMRGTEDAQTIRSAVFEMGEELKPVLQGLSRFQVQLDIDAISQMEAAGIERHHAVALRLRQPMTEALGVAVTKAATLKKTATR